MKKARTIIGAGLFIVGIAAATTIDGSLIITFLAIAMMVAGGLIADLFDKEGAR